MQILKGAQRRFPMSQRSGAVILFCIQNVHFHLGIDSNKYGNKINQLENKTILYIRRWLKNLQFN